MTDQAHRYLIRFAAATDVGPTRQRNEDSLTVGSILVTGTSHLVMQGDLQANGRGPLVAVIDGMGGHLAGHLASTLTARYLSNRPGLLGGRASDPDQAAHDVLNACNRMLYYEMERDPQVCGMGAAIAGLALLPEATVVFNLGDVAVFQHSGGYLLEVSEDHRAANGKLLQSLGGTVDPVALHPHVEAHQSPPGTRWLVCSDGLYDVVPFTELQEAMVGPDIWTTTTSLLHTALAGGTTDNVSLIVVET